MSDCSCQGTGVCECDSISRANDMEIDGDIVVNMSEMEIHCFDCEGVHKYGACPLEGICLFCKKRPATLHFGDMLSFTHGGNDNCCEICCTEKQLEHAKERAAVIPELRLKLMELLLEEDKKTYGEVDEDLMEEIRGRFGEYGAQS